MSHEAGIRKIDAAANRAIELSPDLADGHLALALLLQHDFLDQRSAHEAINKAIELNPGNPRMQIEFARMNSHYGNRDISIAAAQRAVELDPVSVFANHILGHVLYFGRQYQQAIEAFRRALELDPHYPKPHYFISMSLYWLGDDHAALKEIELEPLQWMRHTASVVILHRLGRKEEAEAHRAWLVEIGVAGNSFKQQADIHSQLGNTEKAFECLQRALDLGDPGLTQLLVDPFLDPIRDDPRFLDLTTKVGLAKPVAAAGSN